MRVIHYKFKKVEGFKKKKKKKTTSSLLMSVPVNFRGTLQ